MNRCHPIPDWISIVLVVAMMLVRHSIANDEAPIVQEQQNQNPASRPTTKIAIGDFARQLAGWSQPLHKGRLDFPRKPRVSRSSRPLRELTLIGGDRVAAEVLDWGSQTAQLRLQDGQMVNLPVAAVSCLANPPGEVDVLAESFEADSPTFSEPKLRSLLDQTESASGASSLKLDSSSQEFRQSLDPPLASARIEFSFRVASKDPSSACGEWQIDWEGPSDTGSPLIVRVGGDRRVTTSRGVGVSSPQILEISEGWHSLIALVTPERTRLMIDEAMLDSRTTPKGLLKAIHFRSGGEGSKNVLWIDDLQIRKIGILEQGEPFTNGSHNRDRLTTEAGDELFGKIIGVTANSVSLDSLGKIRSIPLHRLKALNWSQPLSAVRQSNLQKRGMVATIQLQPFVDRPESDPGRLTVTVVSVNSSHLFTQHPIIGDLKIAWSDVLRIETWFFGQSVLVDERSFHLGNSLRSDFHRHLPDGTFLKGEFVLPEIPAGKPFFSLNVAELEASGPDAPRGSPFLGELRAGNLVSEVFINEQPIGNLNQQIRFKSKIENPERLRLAIPADLLKRGANTFELRQHPLKKNAREFDDVEVGNIRIDFES